jgi:serine/threonine protein kinase
VKLFKPSLITLVPPLETSSDSKDKLRHLPIVLIHGDLSPTNILTDPTGHITAVIDWDHSMFLPFGWNFYGVDLFFGSMSARDDGTFAWTNKAARPELEEIFWTTFWENTPKEIKLNKSKFLEALKVGRGVGILWQYVGPDPGVASFLENFADMFLPILRTLLAE